MRLGIFRKLYHYWFDPLTLVATSDVEYSFGGRSNVTLGFCSGTLFFYRSSKGERLTSFHRHGPFLRVGLLREAQRLSHFWRYYGDLPAMARRISLD